jgi:adenine-specific DNA-methyltransferase
VRTVDEVSGDKLRGGFYSPDVLVDLCLRRSQELLGGREDLRVLEPTAGDGAFLRGLARSDMASRVSVIEAIEVLDAEARKASALLTELKLPGRVWSANVLSWNESAGSKFDLAIGNPPYVRFQFISAADKQLALTIGSQLGISNSAVSNLWIPIFLLSLQRLVEGGVFSMILPAEFLTGVSAGRVRAWLLSNSSSLTVDLFKPGSFPAVLQEVLVITGQKDTKTDAERADVHFHDHNGGTEHWTHTVSPAAKTWTPYLLKPKQEAALAAVSSLAGVVRLGDEARFTVSTVTGANSFFCVDSETLRKKNLDQWAMALLPRTRYAPGLTFSQEEHLALAASPAPSWLLSFSADREAPSHYPDASYYIAEGERAELHNRFKCRVRTPWFRVPVVPPGELLMSKRSATYPRVIVNDARVVTTDTIYRGQMLPTSRLSARSIAAAFHNSITLLSVETGGRSFGGGVLELVPSEIAALLIPRAPSAGQSLPDLDRLVRSSADPDALIDETDKLLLKWLPGLAPDVLVLLREARQDLLGRRVMRSLGRAYEE